MHAGVGCLRSIVINAERGNDTKSLKNGPQSAPAIISATTADTILVAEGTTVDDGGTRPKVLCKDVV